MNIATVENIVMLLSAVIGLFISVFRYIETPKRGWLYVTGFFLAHFLSDYYWAAYTFIIHDDPDVSALMAYFGWNVAFALLMAAAIHMRDPASKKFFHPLVFLPIPLNIAQVILYLQYGGYFNNIWQGTFLTIAECVCVQSLLYYAKNRKEGAKLPLFNTLALSYILMEFSMWTISCFNYPDWKLDPYYVLEFAGYITIVFFAEAVGRDYRNRGVVTGRMTINGMRLRMLLQITASIIIFGGCIGGLQIASWMKDSIPEGAEDGYGSIAVTLFVISVVLAALIGILMFFISVRYKKMRSVENEDDMRSSRTGFITTVILSFVLMCTSVIFTARLIYRVSVDGVSESGEDTTRLVAAEIENHLAAASAALQVTADTVETMMKRGESQEKLLIFLTDQTDNQKKFFEDDLTGLYGLIRGEYMDGLGWEPPEGYDPTTRDWYIHAKKGAGEVVMVPPYVDAQTGEVIITIARQIEDYEGQERFGSSNVVAIDILLTHIQEVIENTDLNGKGSAMVINDDGLIICHADPDVAGESFADIYGPQLFDQVSKTGTGVIDCETDGEGQTLFVRKIMDQWYVAIMVSDSELFEESRFQLAMTITVSFVVFALISFFYYLGYRNEQFFAATMEEMRSVRVRQEYEAKALMLEKQAADNANKAKSGFLADMSHEIRTPINAILGMNEMILRESDDRDILEYAGNIDTSGRALLQLINSILDFSKIEDGKMEIVPVEYEFAPALSYLANSISGRSKAKGLDLLIDVDPALPSKLFGDEARIKQVVVNLLTNAVKYTNEGSVTLSVRQKERSDGKVLIHVEVKDTGIGIREEDMPRLFESFERLDLVKNRNIEGTGLGMSIVTKLLALMDSSLKVESVYGKGSVFSFDILQEIRDEKPVGQFDASSAGASSHNKDKGILFAPDAHILLTDDTKMNIMVVQKLLKRTGIQIDTADSGQKAIELAEKNAYDLILMDQRMPNMDGDETMKRIRELPDPKNAANPVICLTADAIRGAKEKYIALGFTDYLTKPIDSSELENMLLKYLPPEKVASSKADPHNKTADGSLYEKLAKEGIDTETGLEYCQQDEDLYVEVLKEFAGSIAGTLRNMQESYDASDWEEYRVFVHSIKSSSRTIGAEKLSERSAALEAAAAKMDADLIHAEHDDLVKLCRKTADGIRNSLE